MGGQIGVTSTVGQGSTFTFTLPVSTVPDSILVPRPSSASESARFDGAQILVVEDNPVNILVSEGILSQLGCEVSHAENGEIALKMVQEGQFDLVLMDVRMPVMDGLTATVEIRRRELGTGNHTKIVALTAGALAQEREACFEAGMDDYLVKPFSKASLRETLYRNLITG
jgi:CheY-like chemotaxis protein